MGASSSSSCSGSGASAMALADGRDCGSHGGAEPPPADCVVSVETALEQAAAKAVIGTQLSRSLGKFSAFLWESMRSPVDRRTKVPYWAPPCARADGKAALG